HAQRAPPGRGPPLPQPELRFRWGQCRPNHRGGTRMYELTFSPMDIDRWARFSGDYNPIHFDPAQARKLGADDVIAHGMLVLLAIKSRLSAAVPPGGGWWLLRGRMRQPVVARAAALLDTRPQGDGVAFSLASQAGRKLL